MPNPLIPRRVQRGLLPALLPLALAACANMHGLAPERAPRDPATVQATRSLGHARVSDAAWPTTHWWSAFGDPQLDTLMDEALAGSPSIAAADARVRKAMAQAGLAEAGVLPTLGVGAQEGHIRLPETLAPAPIGGKLLNATIVSLKFDWSPDLWGGKHARWDAALGAARAQEADAQAARATLAANVARTYSALAQAWDAKDVAEADVQRNASLRKLAELRVKAGIDNQVLLSQVTSAEAAARTQANIAQQQIDALRTALAMLAGQGPDRGMAINRPHLGNPRIAVPSVVASDLVARRADVVAARWRVEAASRGIAASKADFYPTLNLAAMVGLAAGNLSDLFGTDALLVNGGPAISLPIFDGGRLRNQLAGSNADYDLAVAGYDQAVLGAIREVVDAVQSARELDTAITAARQSRDAQARALSLVQQRYKAGLANQLDVLNAQKPLLQLDQQLASLRGKRIDAAIALDTALGGGVPVTPASDPAPHASVFNKASAR